MKNKGMTFEEYSKTAKITAQYPKDKGLVYLAFGLASEAGEVLGKLKKLIRDHENFDKALEENKYSVADELGDVLWYLSQLARELEVPLCEVAQRNNEKLLDRLARNAIMGSGDER
tara:strand:+ start:279 stop:626 length:348 start_codon:yes stop_codon:yes gene_type:complete